LADPNVEWIGTAEEEEVVGCLGWLKLALVVLDISLDDSNPSLWLQMLILVF